MSAELNETVHRRYVEECWSDGDIDLQDQLVAEDVVDHNPFPGVPTGHEGRRARGSAHVPFRVRHQNED